MEMIVAPELLPPSMQHGGHADLGLEALPSKLQQRLAGRVKKQLIQRPPVLPNQGVQRVRQREHHMKVGNRQQHRPLPVQPFKRLRALALWTMPVATPMRHKMFPAALATPITVTAQRRG